MMMVMQIGVVRPVYMEGVGEAGPSSWSMYSEVREAAGVGGSGELPRLDDIPNIFVLEGLEGNRGMVYIIDAGVGPVGSTGTVASELIVGAEHCVTVSYLQLQDCRVLTCI